MFSMIDVKPMSERITPVPSESPQDAQTERERIVLEKVAGLNARVAELEEMIRVQGVQLREALDIAHQSLDEHTENGNPNTTSA